MRWRTEQRDIILVSALLEETMFYELHYGGLENPFA